MLLFNLKFEVKSHIKYFVTPHLFVQRNGAKLFAVGTASSLVSTSITPCNW